MQRSHLSELHYRWLTLFILHRDRNAEAIAAAQIADDPEAGRKACLNVARYIPRALDAFCDIREVIKTCVIFDRAEEGDEMAEKMADRISNIM